VLGLIINLEKKQSPLSLSNLKIDLPFGGVEKIKEPRFSLIPHDLCDFATEQDLNSISLYFSVVLLCN